MTGAAPQTRRLAGKPRVIVTRKLLPVTEERMKALFDVTFNEADRPFSRAELADAMGRCDVLVPTVTDTIDAGLIAGASPSLGLIANFGAGVDHIATDEARARKIIVTNTPAVFTDDTADMALSLILSVSRRLPAGVRQLMTGKWDGWSPSSLLGHSISGKRLAIIGMGRIGQAVAHRARAFGMQIHYHNRTRLAPAIEMMLSARYEPDLDTLVAEADIVTLHCPASPSTRHILDARRIGLIKPEAYVVNAARGSLIDQDALVEALQNGLLGGAALDVFANEPAVDPRLFEIPTVLTTPHMGSGTFEGREAAGQKVIANIQFWVDGHRPPDQVLPGMQ